MNVVQILNCLTGISVVKRFKVCTPCKRCDLRSSENFEAKAHSCSGAADVLKKGFGIRCPELWRVHGEFPSVLEEEERTDVRGGP